MYYNGFEGAAARKWNNGWSTDENDALRNAEWHYTKELEDGWAPCGDDLIWHYDTATRTISIKGSGPMWDFSFNERPWEEYAGKLVGVSFESGITTIGKNAFTNCERLRTVELPDGVTSIGDYAFSSCSSLSSVEFPGSLTTIGKSAFSVCSSLTSVALPDGVTSIGNYAFSDCGNLMSVEFPACLTTIGDWAFLYCSGLTNVALPDGVTSIGNYAFSDCDGLISVALPAGLIHIEEGVFSRCSALASVTLPESLAGIGERAFQNCSNLMSVEFPAGLINIGDYAFVGCNELTSVTIPASITSIGDRAFSGCSSLKSVVFLGGAPNIGGSSFGNVTANAYYPDDGSWWEDDLQDYGGTLTWIPYDSRTAFASGKSLSLKGKIEVNFYLILPDSLLADPGAYVTINGDKILISDARTREVRGATNYVFSVKVKFAQLTDEQILRVYTGEDELVTLKDYEGNDLTETGLIYRAQDYIEYVRTNSQDEGLVKVVNALSDVGSLAQVLFNYNVESRVDLVNDLSEVTADMVADYAPTHEAAEGAAIRYYGSSLLLQDVTMIRHYFKLREGSIEDYTFTVDGVEVTPVEKDSFYYIDITGIVARDLDRSFHVEVSSSDGVAISLDYSAMSYAYSQIGSGETTTLTDLMKAVVLYTNAANEYFAD